MRVSSKKRRHEKTPGSNGAPAFPRMILKAVERNSVHTFGRTGCGIDLHRLLIFLCCLLFFWRYRWDVARIGGTGRSAATREACHGKDNKGDHETLTHRKNSKQVDLRERFGSQLSFGFCMLPERSSTPGDPKTAGGSMQRFEKASPSPDSDFQIR